MSLLDEVDYLYERAVMFPTTLSDQAFADWTEAVGVGPEMDKESARYIRRCLNVSRKLAAFWSARDVDVDDPDEWRSRVDLSLGVRAWRPQLDLASRLLDASGDEAAFGRVVELFRIVNNEPFLEGASYQDWFESRQN